MSTRVDQMFSRIAGRYDRTNRFISLGADQWMRRKAVAACGAKLGDDVLDCAAGTGDLTLLFYDVVGRRARVVGTDINEDMLAHAREKAAKRGARIHWQVADVQALPFPEESFDIISIAYGIRNVDEPVRALKSMARVLRPGGRLVVLEFGQPASRWLRPFYLAYNRGFVPVVGGLVGADKDAYRYLQATSDSFPCGDAFVEWMRQTGEFGDIHAIPMLFGANYIYVGTRG